MSTKKQKKSHACVIFFLISKRSKCTYEFFFSSFFIFWKSYICEPRCVETHISTYTHRSFLLGDGTHKVCMCVSFLFLKTVKSKSLVMVSKHSFGKPPSIQLCKVITLENFKFIKIETSFTSTMVAPLIDL